MALNLRQNLQISSAQFDFYATLPLGYMDLYYEIGQSRVYNVETKRHLVDIVGQMAELCSVLTKMIELIYLPNGTLASGGTRLEQGMTELAQCRVSMHDWYNCAASLYPDVLGNPNNEDQTISPSRQTPHTGPIILYRSFLFMQYQ